MRACITKPHFAGLITGICMEWFASSMGLMQGDPISPYLFILGMEYLTKQVKNAAISKTLMGFRPSRNNTSINPLTCAEYCLLTTRAEINEGVHLTHIV